MIQQITVSHISLIFLINPLNQGSDNFSSDKVITEQTLPFMLRRRSRSYRESFRPHESLCVMFSFYIDTLSNVSLHFFQ